MNLQREKIKSQEGRWHLPGLSCKRSWFPILQMLVSWLLKEVMLPAVWQHKLYQLSPQLKYTGWKWHTWKGHTLEASLFYLGWWCLIREVICAGVFSLASLPSLLFSLPDLPLSCRLGSLTFHAILSLLFKT